ncbi:MAG: hypothetical protein ACXVBW_06485 [Bdellovibrionota bacterium]
MIGFTRGSQPNTSAWASHFDEKYGSESRAVGYSIAVLEGIPFFLKGFIRSGIRSKVPVDRFLDPHGEITWQWHGPFSEKEFQSFQGTFRP